MPELPEGTINAFIQNKNLAKYGLLKDNDGGFLAENFVDYQLIDRHETLEEIVADHFTMRGRASTTCD